MSLFFCCRALPYKAEEKRIKSKHIFFHWLHQQRCSCGSTATAAPNKSCNQSPLLYTCWWVGLHSICPHCGMAYWGRTTRKLRTRCVVEVFWYCYLPLEAWPILFGTWITLKNHKRRAKSRTQWKVACVICTNVPRFKTSGFTSWRKCWVT